VESDCSSAVRALVWAQAHRFHLSGQTDRRGQSGQRPTTICIQNFSTRQTVGTGAQQGGAWCAIRRLRTRESFTVTLDFGASVFDGQDRLSGNRRGPAGAAASCLHGARPAPADHFVAVCDPDHPMPSNWRPAGEPLPQKCCQRQHRHRHGPHPNKPCR